MGIGRPWPFLLSHAMRPRHLTLSALERRAIACLPGIAPGRRGRSSGWGPRASSGRKTRAAGPRRLSSPWPACGDLVSARTVGRVLGQTYDRARAELDACAAYFGPHIVPTRRVGGARTGSICVLRGPHPRRSEWQRGPDGRLADGPCEGSEPAGSPEADRRGYGRDGYCSGQPPAQGM